MRTSPKTHASRQPNPQATIPERAIQEPSVSARSETPGHKSRALPWGNRGVRVGNIRAAVTLVRVRRIRATPPCRRKNP
jgi:hypothetical protein